MCMFTFYFSAAHTFDACNVRTLFKTSFYCYYHGYGHTTKNLLHSRNLRCFILQIFAYGQIDRYNLFYRQRFCWKQANKREIREYGLLVQEFNNVARHVLCFFNFFLLFFILLGVAITPKRNSTPFEWTYFFSLFFSLLYIYYFSSLYLNRMR